MKDRRNPPNRSRNTDFRIKIFGAFPKRGLAGAVCASGSAGVSPAEPRARRDLILAFSLIKGLPPCALSPPRTARPS